MNDMPVEQGPFTEERPYRKHCGSKIDHEAHGETRVLTRRDGGRYSEYRLCPGWKTTQWVVVYDTNGDEMGRLPVDIRREFEGVPSDLLCTIVLEAREAGQVLSQTKKEALLAIGHVAPDVCPYDCERCREHLPEIREELEGR